MIFQTRQFCIACTTALFISSPALALDARSAALGGSAIANGAGAHGALENPSSLMRMKREQQNFHIHLGLSTDIQDDAGLVDIALDNESLPEDLETEIDAISGRTITCAVPSAPETVCLNDTQRLGNLAGTVLDILNDIDNKPIKATAAAEFGVAYAASPIPIALHYRQSVTGRVQSDIEDSDTDYVDTFATVLSDDQLTFNELSTAVPLTISDDGTTLSVQQPEDALQSDAQSSALIREQLGVSIATTFQIAGLNVDFGITPKFSELRSLSLTTAIGERFDDAAESLQDQFEDNEVIDTSFNVDLGVSAAISGLPLRVSAVARNMITESVTTKENFEFETTPQLIVGGAFELGALTLSADLALNEAKVDNLETQIMALGVELAKPLFGLRAGISHDNARTDDATALSLGFSLGPLHLGGRITDRQSAQAGVQLAFGF